MNWSFEVIDLISCLVTKGESDNRHAQSLARDVGNNALNTIYETVFDFDGSSIRFCGRRDNLKFTDGLEILSWCRFLLMPDLPL